MICRTICPAKINSFLAVDPPDHSGYHPIRSIFRAISLADELSIQDSPSGKDEIICNWGDLPANNTLTKTLRFLRELLPIAPLRIELTKNIPNEAGLGGGSSDAAGLLRALGTVAPHFVTEQYQREVAFAVGADVTFFLTGGAAKAEGYGQFIEPLPDPEIWHLLLVKPEAGISTPQAYKKLDSTERPHREFPTDLKELYNDFERVAPCICGEIAERLQVHGAKGALLSGSGSAVFGVFETEALAQQAEKHIKSEELGETYLARTLTREESLATTLSS
ncbi:MAG: 4-(cytidine 5'-diphospho)-2-C-methyl-D-erythritol kinase [Fimbriimonadaceae bacterium]|nr:MAG: 4-(cytidine 5'-diphospho)-2-C-methyl-D-erythritol kinase [Fimbriimonadaceae bacterium]